MSKQNIWKYYAITGTAVVIAAIVAGAIAYATGRLHVTFSQSGSAVVVMQNVCNDDIDQYNSLVKDADSNKLVKFLNDLGSKQGSDTDATCLFMQAQGFVFAGNADKAKEALEKLKIQVAQQQYPSMKVRTLTSIESLQSMVSGRAGNALDEGAQGSG